MSRLFQPLSVGPITLQHRVAMAPLTRYRWGDDWDATGMKDMIIGVLKYIGSRHIENNPLTYTYRVLRTESVHPRHADHQRSHCDCKKCRRTPQLSGDLVRNPDFLLEGHHHSSTQQRLSYLLPALAPRPIGGS